MSVSLNNNVRRRCGKREKQIIVSVHEERVHCILIEYTQTYPLNTRAHVSCNRRCVYLISTGLNMNWSSQGNAINVRIDFMLRGGNIMTLRMSGPVTNTNSKYILIITNFLIRL